jgi:hypothetical protein
MRAALRNANHHHPWLPPALPHWQQSCLAGALHCKAAILIAQEALSTSWRGRNFAALTLPLTTGALLYSLIMQPHSY